MFRINVRIQNPWPCFTLRMDSLCSRDPSPCLHICVVLLARAVPVLAGLIRLSLHQFFSSLFISFDLFCVALLSNQSSETEMVHEPKIAAVCRPKPPAANRTAPTDMPEVVLLFFFVKPFTAHHAHSSKPSLDHVIVLSTIIHDKRGCIDVTSLRQGRVIWESLVLIWGRVRQFLPSLFV